MKILLAIINNRPDLNVQFVQSLLRLIFTTSDAGHEVTPSFYDYYDVSEMRNIACRQTIEMNMDYVFFMDADMIYPDDSIIKLLQFNVSVIGGMYNTRKLPTLPVHFRKIKQDRTLNNPENRDYKFNSNLQEQEAGGLGGVLVKREVLISMEDPYFKVEFWEIDGVKGFFGEDIYFFFQLKKLKIKSYVDTDLNYGHVINGAVYADGKLKII